MSEVSPVRGNANATALSEQALAAIERERVETLYRFNRSGVLLSFLLGPLAAWRLGAASSGRQFMYWCAALYAVAAFRAFLGWRFDHARTRLSDNGWHRLLILSAVLVGACWGSLVTPLFDMPVDARLLVTALLMAVMGIGLITYMASTWAFLALSLPMFFGLIHATATHQTALGFDASLMVTFFIGIMVIGSRKMSAQFDGMLRAQAHEARMRSEADLANAAKSRFLAAMSHEVRTPINGILGMAEMLRMAGLGNPLNGYVNAMRKSCKHLVGVVNDVLDFARINARKLRIEPSDFDLREMVAETLLPHELQAHHQGLGFELWIDDRLPQYISCDRLRLAQILINLVSNAIKFTSSGCVSVRLLQAEPGRWKIEVEDTGIGIAAEKLATIFTPFTQADASSSRRYGGTGLGLSISHELVTLMQGTVDVQSTPGRGSTFRVELPLTIAKPPPSESPETAPPRFDADVLVVEDNELNREIAVLFLESMGLRARCAHNGEEAIAAYQTFQPDVILMDCEMPILDGMQATRRLRAQGATLPILALTAHALPESHRECLESGMDAVLTKPLDIDQLRTALGAALLQRARA